MIHTTKFHHRYVPARIPGSRERLVVVLHGLGDSLAGWSFLPDALRVPELSYLFVNAPDPYYGGYSWYEFMGDKEPGVLRGRALLLELIDELKEQELAASDIFLLGFSQGCLMAVDAGLHAPEPLGGIVGISGYVAFPERYPADFAPAAVQQKILITHGRRDPVVPYEPSRKQFLELRKLGVDLELLTYDKEHTVLPEELADIAAWLRERLD